MKKWLLIIPALFIIILLGVHFIIPQTQDFFYSKTVKCNPEAASRFIFNKNKWRQWWPGQKKTEDVYAYKNFDYTIKKITLNSVDIIVSNDGDSMAGTIKVLPDTSGQIRLEWVSPIELSFNPLARPTQYSTVKKMKENISGLITAGKLFFEKQENVYGMRINVEKVKDSCLISYSKTFDHYPATDEVYDMIATLKKYVITKKGTESNYPMLHVQTISPSEYIVMAAIPTVQSLPSEGDFKTKNMVLGNILTGEVKGGIYNIITGEQELRNFVTDFRRMSPAIPYQMLITNRMHEPDTAKWVTRLYYPIF